MSLLWREIPERDVDIDATIEVLCRGMVERFPDAFDKIEVGSRKI